MKILIVLLLALGVCACSVQSKSLGTSTAGLAGDVPEEQAVICKKEKPTGSNRPVTVCRPVAGAIQKEQTDQDMRVLRRQSDLIRQSERSN